MMCFPICFFYLLVVFFENDDWIGAKTILQRTFWSRKTEINRVKLAKLVIL